MSYTTDDTSLASGSPVELYRFEGPGRVYTYTSHFEDVVYANETYQATELERASIRSVTDDDPPTATIRVPFDTPFVSDYAFANPPAWATVTIRRYHLGSGPSLGVTYFTGDVTEIRLNGRVAEIEALVVAHRFEEPLPNVRWQRRCNHELFGPRCKVLAINFRVPSSSVVSIDSTGTEITVLTVDGIPALDGASTPADYLANGTITRLSDGETRLIKSNGGLSNAVLTISRPFPALDVLDQVIIAAGCDLAVTTCHAKFDNVENFGGHPVIPRQTLFGEDFAELFPPPP